MGELFQEEQIYRIDHYVAKESLFNIVEVHRKSPKYKGSWNNKNIQKVEINLFEKGVVGSRGSFYDGVGALRDVGQNHMLQILALVAMDIPEKLDANSIQNARKNVLENLVRSKPVDKLGMKRGQYEGYLYEMGARPN